MTTRTTADWQALDAAHFLHPFTDFQALAKKGSRIIERGENVYLWDTDGHRLFDAMSGLWCVNVGYGQQALIDAATAQMAKLPFYNSFFQTTTPPAPCTGSPMKAATLSGPTSRILASSQPAAFRPNSSRVRPAPCSSQCGWSMWSMPGIGRPPCACMYFMPPSEAPAMVEPW